MPKGVGVRVPSSAFLNIIIKMKIEKTTTENNLSDILINLEPQDYNEEYHKKIKQIRQSVNIPGFRPGKAPLSLIEKRYKADVLSEEIIKKAYDLFYQYINENKISYVGKPIMKFDNFNLDKDTEFAINFQIIELPHLDIDLPQDLELTKYNIIVNDEEINDVIDSMTNKMGQIQDVDSFSEADYVLLDFEFELDDSKINKFVSIEPKKEKKLKLDALKDITIDNSIEINVLDVFNTFEEANEILFPNEQQKLDTDKKIKLSLKFAYKIEPAPIDQVLFDNVFPSRNIQSEEEFRQSIAEVVEKSHKADTINSIIKQLTDYLLENYPFDLPKDILYEQMVQINNEQENGLTPEQISDNFDVFVENIKREHYLNIIAVKYGINIEFDDYKNLIASEYNISSDDLENDEEKKQLVDYMLEQLSKDSDALDDARNVILVNKVYEIVLDKCNIVEKEITYLEFSELNKN